MPARWLQAKYLKIKKMKRELALQKPRQFHGVDTAKVQAYDIFANRPRVATTQGSGPGTSPKLNNTFCRDYPEQVVKHSYNPDECVDPTEPGKEVSRNNVRLTEHVIVKKGWNSTPRAKVEVRLRQEIELTAAKKRGDVLRTFKVWQGVRGQGIVQYHEHVVKEITSTGYTLKLLFQGPEFIFVQEYQGKRWVSCTYTTLLAAKAAVDANMISWIIQEKI